MSRHRLFCTSRISRLMPNWDMAHFWLTLPGLHSVWSTGVRPTIFSLETSRHSDLCLEVSNEKIVGRTPVLQTECSPGKVSQKWAMSQFGINLEIRDVQNNRCLDILRKGTGNYAPIYLQSCNDGPNQRWRLNSATLNTDQGIICKASPSHPEYECSGVNDQQKPVSLGKTLTRARCDEVCRVNKMISCKWEGP